MRAIILVVFAAALLPADANAWLRQRYSDQEIASRAQLIVVGRIKPGTLRIVDHKTDKSWEHHGVLIITEELKGHTDAKEIPVIIHYGLDPIVSGHVETENLSQYARPARPDAPKNAIEIFDTGNSGWRPEPISGDIREDHIWLLRVEKTRFNDGEDALGIYDPEDIQPVNLKERLQILANAKPYESLIGDGFRANDAISACRFAQSYFFQNAPPQVKTGDYFKAQSLGLTRAPVDGGGLKRGDLVWIVLVQNLAESDLNPIPRALVWVRAQDGHVFEINAKN